MEVPSYCDGRTLKNRLKTQSNLLWFCIIVLASPRRCKDLFHPSKNIVLNMFYIMIFLTRFTCCIFLEIEIHSVHHLEIKLEIITIHKWNLAFYIQFFNQVGTRPGTRTGESTYKTSCCYLMIKWYKMANCNEMLLKLKNRASLVP